MVLPVELTDLIRQGESLTVEFKKSTTDITKDVYDTVCSFSNIDGGHIFFGVKDDGTILGVNKDCVEQMKKNFVTTISSYFTSLKVETVDIVFVRLYGRILLSTCFIERVTDYFA